MALQANPFPYLQGFKTFGNPEVTNSVGGFSFPVVGMPVNTQLRVVTTAAPFISSPVLVQGVAVRVSFHVHRVHRSAPGASTACTAPSPRPRSVRLWASSSCAPASPRSTWAAPSSKSATPTVSSFSTVVRVRHRGVYQALVQVSDGSHVSAYSEPIRIR